MAYEKPTTLSDALDLRAKAKWQVLAGGTDLYPATAAQVLPGDVLDIGGITALREIKRHGAGLRIGALTTWSDLAQAQLPPALAGLQAAARDVGAIQIQNAATIMGNLCNASPAADGVPPLMCLDAKIELCSHSGKRLVDLGDFITGNRKTVIRPNELATAIELPLKALSGSSAFVKLGARHSLVISIVMAAARTVVEDERLSQVALCIGAASLVARRLPALEAALVGKTPQEALTLIDTSVEADEIAAQLAPIDDVRATASYRAEIASQILRDALAASLESETRP